LNKMAEHFKRRGILILISDFYEEPDTVLEAIKPLKFLGNDLIVFHVLDPAEMDFGYEDASSFEDLETGEQIPVVPQSLREEYGRMIRAHIEALTTKFSEHRIDYTLVNTAEPLDRALFSYLSSRERLSRVRRRESRIPYPDGCPDSRVPHRTWCPRRSGTDPSDSALVEAWRRIPLV